MAFGPGAHLASINDAIGNDWFRQTFCLHRSELWIGLNDVAVEGTFEWTSGQPVDFMNWAPSPTSVSNPLLGKSALR